MADDMLSVVRAGDKDMFLSILFAPEDAQPHLFALQAFAVELARIPLLVSEPQVGEIRLQWWADTLAAMASGQEQHHPIAMALAATIAAHNLPVAPLLAMVEARRFDLYADKIASLHELDGHCGETRSALFQLACHILDPTGAPRASEASGYAGVAFEIARSLLTPSAQKYVPEGMDRSDVVAHAKQRHDDAISAIGTLPRSLAPAFLPLALVPLYLKAGRAGKTSVPQWKRQWRLWRAAG